MMEDLVLQITVIRMPMYRKDSTQKEEWINQIRANYLLAVMGTKCRYKTLIIKVIKIMELVSLLGCLE